MDLDRRRIRLDPAVRSRVVEAAGAALSTDAEVAAAWLHGSVARGEPARDVDIAVLPRPGADPWAVADRVALALEAAVPVGLPYDVRPVTREVDAEFRYDLVREGVLVTDNDQDARALFWAEAVRDYLDVAPMLERSRRALRERLARGA